MAPSSCRCEDVRCIRQCLSGATMALVPASATTPLTASSPPPLSYICVTLPSVSLCFPRRPPLHSLTSRTFPSPLMSFPVLPHPSPPPVMFSCYFPLFLLLYASDGSSADLTTAQLMCPRTSTLTAPSPHHRLADITCSGCSPVLVYKPALSLSFCSVR